jgi:predicted Zn-ribbon and HTH transcriptional regulator
MEEKQLKDVNELVEIGLATYVELENKQYKTEPPSGVRPGQAEPESHTHIAVVDEMGMGDTKPDATRHVHKVRNWVALYSGVGPHIHKIVRMQANSYECSCVKCGFTMLTEKHCVDIKCPKCGSEMRRADRTGRGTGTPTKTRENMAVITEMSHGHQHQANVNDVGNGATYRDDTGHMHLVKNWIAEKGELNHQHVIKK